MIHTISTVFVGTSAVLAMLGCGSFLAKEEAGAALFRLGEGLALGFVLLHLLGAVQ